MLNPFWREIRSYHSEKTGMTELIVEYMSVFEILRLCASGIANASIAEMLSLEEYYVKETVIEFLDFPGFASNLPYSPYRFYKVTRDYDKFAESIEGTYGEASPMVKILWTICYKTYAVEKEIDKYE